jgi:PAS domain S-box-containing protein
MLVYFIRRRKDFPYLWPAVIFAGFIVAGGTTHLLSAITIWIPLYWLNGVLKAFTAIISIATAVLLLRVIHRALSAPSATQLQAEIEQRKTAETALLVANVTLQKNIAHTQLLLDSALDGIVSMDHNGNVIGWNAQAEHIFGYSCEQALGHDMAELIVPPAYRERHKQGLSRFLATGTSNVIGTRIEITGLRADASEFPMELTIGALKQKDGYFFSAYVRDISERRITEDALRESEYRWKFAIEGSGDGVWDWDLRTNEAKYSSRWKEMLGYAENDIVATEQEWVNRIHPDDQSYVAGVLQACLTGKTAIYVSEHRLRCKDGSYKWILARGTVVSRSEDGKPLRMIGTHTDISERKQAEESLRQSRKELQDAQRIAHMGSWQLDAATHHAVWSEELYRILGLNPELPMPDYTEYYRLFAPDSWERLSSAMLHTQETGIPYELELEMVRADGTHGWMLARGEAIRDGSETIVGLHGVALDISERKQAERTLNQLKAMIDISLDGFWIVDLEGNVLQVNEAYAKMSGYSVDELESMHASQLEAIEESEQIKAHLAKAVAMGYEQFETRLLHKNGHTIVIEVSATFLPEFQQFCVFCRDITQRKLMEEELKTSEAKFRSIIEACPVPMALNDKQLNITFLNPAFVQTFGYSENDIPTLADWRQQAYPDPDYRQWVETAWQAIREKAKQEQTECPPMEVEIHCKNNRIKTVLVTAAKIHHSFAGEHLVILYDITPRKQIEAKFNAIFAASVEGIITYDMSDIIVSANAAVEAIFGYQPEELIGCSINKLLPPSPKEMNGCNLPHAVKVIGQIQEIEGIHKNGSVVPLDLSVAEFSIDNAHYFTHIVRDVGLRKHREQQDKEHLDELAHVTRLGLMGEMASGIAHEVNQPLAAISTYTQVSLNIINAEHPDLAKLAEILYKTQQQALRAGQIIHRMREFVKSHAKQRSTADLNTLIHDAVGLCIDELKQNSIKLTFELENNLPTISVDHIQIEQVLINLIRNSVEALQHLPPERQRHLTIHSHLVPNNVIRVRVKDNGPGLDEDQKQQILTPFYTTKSDGMGMGLSITRSLIEAHEGTLHFNSKPGKGTTFYFTLPTQKKNLRS